MGWKKIERDYVEVSEASVANFQASASNLFSSWGSVRSGPRSGGFFDAEEFVIMLILPKSFSRLKYERAVVISVIQ